MIESATVVAIVIGVTEAVKRGLKFDKRIVPIVSLVLGVAIAVALGGFEVDVVVNGLVYGLIASGLYSGGKAVLGK